MTIDKCQTCGGRIRSHCKCFRADKVCVNGHHWHTCLVHRVQTEGEADHSLGMNVCTCGKIKYEGALAMTEGEKEEDIVTMSKNLTYCLQNGSNEDAYNWCVDILKRLHGDALASNARMKLLISDALKSVK